MAVSNLAHIVKKKHKTGWELTDVIQSESNDKTVSKVQCKGKCNALCMNCLWTANVQGSNWN